MNAKGEMTTTDHHIQTMHKGSSLRNQANRIFISLASILKRKTVISSPTVNNETTIIYGQLIKGRGNISITAYKDKIYDSKYLSEVL